MSVIAELYVEGHTMAQHSWHLQLKQTTQVNESCIQSDREPLHNAMMSGLLTCLSKSCDPSVHKHLRSQSSRDQRTKMKTAGSLICI